MKPIALHARKCRAEFILVAEIFLVCLGWLLMRCFRPAAVLPKLDLPFMALLSLIALAAEYYAARRPHQLSLSGVLTAALGFSLLPLCAGLIEAAAILWLLPAGALAFALCGLLYGWVGSRMAAGPHMPPAPALNAFTLYLAFRGFSGFLAMFR